MIGTLTGLVAANPLRERPRRLLMLALYRCGRHAEALAAYRAACRVLDEFEQFGWARGKAGRLEELRGGALEGLAEARLVCREHAGVIAALTGLVPANPLRERPRGCC